MIKRKYFFKVESLPTLQKERRAAGKVTCCTGLVARRSFFSDPQFISDYIKKRVSGKFDFLEHEVIITALNRV